MIAALDPLQQDVGGLEVAVQQAALVDGVQGGCELDRDRACPLGLHRTVAVDQRAQVLAVDPLHDDVGAVAVPAGPVHGDDMRVLHRGGHPRLAGKAGKVVRLGGDLDGDELERDDAVQRDLPRAVDDPHASAARDVQDLEVIDPLPRNDVAHREVS